jgi:hypothetical protein
MKGVSTSLYALFALFRFASDPMAIPLNDTQHMTEIATKTISQVQNIVTLLALYNKVNAYDADVSLM